MPFSTAKVTGVNKWHRQSMSVLFRYSLHVTPPSNATGIVTASRYPWPSEAAEITLY